MGFGSPCVTSPSWCCPTEEYSKRQNNYTNIIEEKLVPKWFYWTYHVDCENYRQRSNKVSPYQPTHKVSLNAEM